MPFPLLAAGGAALARRGGGRLFGGLARRAFGFIKSSAPGTMVPTLGGIRPPTSIVRRAGEVLRRRLTGPGAQALATGVASTAIVTAGAAGLERVVRGRGAAQVGMPGRRRRRMNPINLKALRRAISRLRGFTGISNRVRGELTAFCPTPAGRRAFRRRPRGHRSGCQCVACKAR